MSDSVASSENGSHKVLRTQNQPSSDKEVSPAPPPKPIREETESLALSEKHTAKVEVTEDKEWDDVVTLVEGATALSLNQKELTHRTISVIAALRVAHEKHWKYYCQEKGATWRKEVKSPFQPVVIWVLKRSETQTGENHTSKASMIAGCLDEFWDIKRPQGMKPDEVAAWLDAAGGYTAVYRNRLQRLRGKDKDKDNAEARYSRYLMMQPLDERRVPEYLGSFDGEVLIAARVDRTTGVLITRSVWQPKGNSFWHAYVDKFVATRLENGRSAEVVKSGSVGNGADHTGAESPVAAQHLSAREQLASAGPALTHQFFPLCCRWVCELRARPLEL
jgi:hypothetical protein